MRTLHLTLLAILIATSLSAQPWLQNLPAGKAKSELTLPDYQQAFESYWAPYNVQKGTYNENGVTKKAPGWKQFKRWEYQMSSIVDPASGAFPKKSAMQVREEFERTHPASRTTTAANWTPIGPFSSFSGYSGIGRINCVAFHPTDLNIYWVGAAAGGLWETRDNGTTWTCLTDNNGVLGVSDIVIPDDYDTSNTIYIATGDRDAWDNRSVGVLKTTDGGTTWNETGLSFTIYEGRMVNRLLQDPTNKDVLIAATSIGVFKTFDGGTTWNTKMTDVEFIDMEFNPVNPTIIYGSTKYSQIFLSTDGNSFSPVFTDANANRIELAVSPNQPDWVYAVASNGNSGLYGIFKSTDGGFTYNEVFSGSTKNLLTWESDGSGTGGQGWYDLALAASPLDANILLVGGVNSWRSFDGGVSWSITNHWWGDGVQAVHADKHKHAYRNNGDVFECNDGGVYLSPDNGSSWIDKTNGIQISQMYRLGVSQTEPGDVITGLQDNGTKLVTGNEWYDVRGGDGMECLIDYSDVNIQYSTIYFGAIDRTTNHWQNATNITPPDDGDWVTPFIIDPNNPNILYGGYNQLWKTENRGDSWTQISTIDKAGRVRSIAAAPSDSRYLYIADYQQIFKSTNGGEEWNDITGSLPTSSGTLEYIAVKHDDPNTVWVVLSGYSNPGVYESTDGGQSWNNISTGLPPIPAYSMVQNHQASSEVELYLGTELGVYYKKGTNDWVPYNTGLPNVKTGEIEIYYSSNPGETRLRAASYGRGLWETPIEYTPTPMIYVSSTAVQKELSSVSPNLANQEILKIEIVTNGNLSPFNATSFTFNTTGSTNPATDIANAKLYYTSTSSAFSTANQFGETILAPDGEFTITGDQELGNGRNNFWLTYDIPANAVIGNQLDAQCTAVVLDEPKTLTVSDPLGARVIAFDYCDAGAAELTYEYISRVTIGSIDNPSGKDPGGYTDFTSQVFDLNRGSAIDILVENGVPYFADEVIVYVDWNIDGDFDDAGETVFNSGPSGEMVFKGSFEAPLTTPLGTTRMRVRLHDSQNGPLAEACGFSQWGEVEDYSIRISEWDPCAALNYLDFKATSIPGDYVTLEDEGTVITTADFDNANSDPQDIGFNFEYNCESFSQFILNTNGFIKLGDTPPSAAALFFEDPRVASGGIFKNNNPADVNLLSPMNIDLGPGTGTPEYRVHTSGTAPDRVCTIQYKDVREANTNPVPQFDNMQFQIKLYETSNIIEFVYGDWTPSGNQNDLRPVACGLKGSSDSDDQVLIVSKYDHQEWDDVYFSNSNNASPAAIYYQEPPQSPKPDAGRTFRFIPRYDYDLGITAIYSLGEASLYYSKPQPFAVHVVNTGKIPLMDSGAARILMGEGEFELIGIPSLQPDESVIVSFSDFVPNNIGNTNFVVQLLNDEDEDESNNSLSWTQNTNEYRCNYSSAEGPDEHHGFSPQSDRIYAAKYHISGTASVAAIPAYITDELNNVGKTVYGIILNGSGAIVGQSDPYVITEEDLGGWHNFDIPTPPVFTNDAFYAGLAMESSSPGTSPLGLQHENPARPDTYFESSLDGTGLVELDRPYRLMVGAVLAPTSPVPGFIAGDQFTCNGLSVNLTLQESTGFIQWQESPDGVNTWANVSGGSGSNSATYITPPVNVTTYYRAEVTQPTFAPVYSNVTAVQILPTPGEAGPITGDDVICAGQGEVLYTVEEIPNATSYVWTLPIGASGSSTTNNILVDFGTSSIAGDISVFGNHDGCVGFGSSLYVFSVPETIPQITDISQPTCTVATGSVFISDLPEWSWTITLLPEGFIVLGNGPFYVFENIMPGVHQLLVEDETGCTSILTPEFIISDITAVPPTPTITANDNLLHSDAPEGNQWYDANGPIPGATDQDYLALVDGDYYVIVTLEGCESDPSNTLNIIISSTGIVAGKTNLLIYPNPVSDQLMIEVPGNTKLIPYEIHDAFGALVFSGEVAEKSYVDTKALVPGIYFIQIGIAGQTVNRKFVKE
jgi:photosystem II stability/assembly factor-like uncharacterized protein